MTIWAGIYQRKDRPIPQTVLHALREAMSRSCDEVTVLNNRDAVLMNVDVDASSLVEVRSDPSGAATLLAGDPLFDRRNGIEHPGSLTSVNRLHGALIGGSKDILHTARGTFAAVHYNPATPELVLIADKLGVRPVYYWVGEEFVMFATALRILMAIDEIPKTADLRALTEITALGYPLGARTAYAGISTLRSGEVVCFKRDAVTRRRYWRWDGIPRSGQPESELAEEVNRQFMAAVDLRLRHNQATVAFLSGGLDSRGVVAALQWRDVQVYSFNVSLPRTQDLILGREFARHAGTVHHEVQVPLATGDLAFYTSVAKAISESRAATGGRVERPRMAWSGDGGSVGLGHVYLSDILVSLMRDGKPKDAVDAFIRQERAHVLPRLLNPAVYLELAQTVRQGILSELLDINCDDPGRSFFIFLLENDQRRHLADFFEDADLHRLEFELPFFDSEFLASVTAVPIDHCLGHRLYMRSLMQFLPGVQSVPWQAYPGHVPCPLPIPPGLSYQWKPTKHDVGTERLRYDLLQRARRLCGAPDFPHDVLNRKHLRLTSLIYRAGLRDYSYVIRAADTYFRHLMACDGRWTVTSPSSDSCSGHCVFQ